MMVLVVTDATGVHVADQLLDSGPGRAGPGLVPDVRFWVLLLSCCRFGVTFNTFLLSHLQIFSSWKMTSEGPEAETEEFFPSKIKQEPSGTF